MPEYINLYAKLWQSFKNSLKIIILLILKITSKDI